MATNPREHARQVLDTFWRGRGYPVDPAKKLQMKWALMFLSLTYRGKFLVH